MSLPPPLPRPGAAGSRAGEPAVARSPAGPWGPPTAAQIGALPGAVRVGSLLGAGQPVCRLLEPSGGTGGSGAGPSREAQLTPLEQERSVWSTRCRSCSSVRLEIPRRALPAVVGVPHGPAAEGARGRGECELHLAGTEVPTAGPFRVAA